MLESMMITGLFLVPFGMVASALLTRSRRRFERARGDLVRAARNVGTLRHERQQTLSDVAQRQVLLSRPGTNSDVYVANLINQAQPIVAEVTRRLTEAETDFNLALTRFEMRVQWNMWRIVTWGPGHFELADAEEVLAALERSVTSSRRSPSLLS